MQNFNKKVSIKPLKNDFFDFLYLIWSAILNIQFCMEDRKKIMRICENTQKITRMTQNRLVLGIKYLFRHKMS